MVNHRNRGNGYERTIVNELKEIGFIDVVTSRAESRNMDAKKVDVFGESLPVNIQCKNSKENFKVADYYLENQEIFPSDKPLVIFHKKTKKAKTRFMTQGEFVYMKKEDFYKMLQDGYKK
jgi:Holliday junction resolvase